MRIWLAFLFVFFIAETADAQMARKKTELEVRNSGSRPIVSFRRILATDTDTDLKPNSAASRNLKLAEEQAAAKNALEQGINNLPEKSEELAELYYNYAMFLKGFEAASNFRKTEKIYKSLHGKSSPKLIDIYMQLGKSFAEDKSKKKAKSALSKAISLAEKNSQTHPVYIAELHITAGSYLLSKASSKDAGSFLKKAVAMLSKPENTEQLVLLAKAKFWLGKYEKFRRNHSRAQAQFESAIDILEKSDPESAIIPTARTFLVSIYQLRREPELVEKQLSLLAKSFSTAPNSDLRPIYQVRPYYPKVDKIERVQGRVILSFTVNEKGAVIDPIAKEVEGSFNFEDAAMEAIANYRFVPRRENGQPVRTEGVEYEFTWKILD